MLSSQRSGLPNYIESADVVKSAILKHYEIHPDLMKEFAHLPDQVALDEVLQPEEDTLGKLAAARLEVAVDVLRARRVPAPVV